MYILLANDFCRGGQCQRVVGSNAFRPAYWLRFKTELAEVRIYQICCRVDQQGRNKRIKPICISHGSTPVGWKSQSESLVLCPTVAS